MKILFKIMAIITCTLACVTIIVITESRFNNFEEIPVASYTPIPTTPVTQAIPLMLSIDSLEVHAPIEPVGVVDGAMGAPATADVVSWYQPGTIPGDPGSAVIAGHVNWNKGQDAIFAKLHTLEIGDILYVTDSHGNRDYFIVTKIKQYKLDANTTEVFSSDDGLAHLNLITCIGVWNPEKKTRESRLVVFTDKI
ncbi:MAG: class F sortase [Candidatus Pacebacteria bacterium]|nr:class F sortase [Candidatus Paceibacterota bacterium]